MKLLGRKIGFKALESILNQMWVKREVITIIDLSNDYYLVAFSHEDNKKAALANGLWFIYDHHLTVKDWSPNFQSGSDTITKYAVWVCIFGPQLSTMIRGLLLSLAIILERLSRLIKQ